MRRQIKIVSRRLSRLPFVGRLVHITAALYHLPRLRGQLEAVMPRVESVGSSLNEKYMMLANSNANANRRLLSVEQSAIGLLTSVMSQVSALKGEVNALVANVADQARRSEQLAHAVAQIGDGTAENAAAILELRAATSDLRASGLQIADVAAATGSLGVRIDEIASALSAIDGNLAATRQAADSATALAATATEAARQFDPLKATIDNVVRSLPMALREMRREQVRLRETLAANASGDIAVASGEQHAEVSSSALEQLASISEQLAGRENEKWLADFAALDERSRQLSTAQSSTAEQVERFVDTLNFLVGRIEFVRREVLFEMRYGKDRGMSADQQLKIAPTIVAVEKVERARQEGLRLNLGCGHVPLEHYVNVDRRALPGVDVVAEVEDLPFTSGEATEIFSSHVLEHFPQEQLVRELLPYWHDLLRAGGEFRAVVPDARAMIDAYANETYPYEDLREVIYGAQDYLGDFHFNMFTPQSLETLLHEAGFAEVRIEASGRKNGKCYEFDIRAIRPS